MIIYPLGKSQKWVARNEHRHFVNYFLLVVSSFLVGPDACDVAQHEKSNPEIGEDLHVAECLQKCYHKNHHVPAREENDHIRHWSFISFEFLKNRGVRVLFLLRCDLLGDLYVRCAFYIWRRWHSLTLRCWVLHLGDGSSIAINYLRCRSWYWQSLGLRIFFRFQSTLLDGLRSNRIFFLKLLLRLKSSRLKANLVSGMP